MMGWTKQRFSHHKVTWWARQNKDFLTSQSDMDDGLDKTKIFSSQSNMDGRMDKTKIFSSQSDMVGWKKQRFSHHKMT
jgi:hypothetical protein